MLLNEETILWEYESHDIKLDEGYSRKIKARVDRHCVYAIILEVSTPTEKLLHEGAFLFLLSK